MADERFSLIKLMAANGETIAMFVEDRMNSAMKGQYYTNGYRIECLCSVNGKETSAELRGMADKSEAFWHALLAADQEWLLAHPEYKPLSTVKADE